ELVAAPFDARVLARGLAARDRQVVHLVASDRERGAGAVDRDFLAVGPQQQPGLAGAFEQDHLLGGEWMPAGPPPPQFDDLDLVAPALDPTPVERTRPTPKARPHGGEAVGVGQD